jgi:alkanesulfonate monooxygenase SsuD/methylene tetrahydromethanopterin reductase-like flavin-dependent oxidoreductase (luciferase family)
VTIVVGGRAERALARAGRFGDGWLGVWSTPDRYRQRVETVEQVAADAGRRAPTGGWRHGLQLWVGVGEGERGRAPLARAIERLYRLPFERFERFSPYGTPAAIVDALAPYVAAGCTSFSISAQADDWRDAIAGVGEVRQMLHAARP